MQPKNINKTHRFRETNEHVRCFRGIWPTATVCYFYVTRKLKRLSSLFQESVCVCLYVCVRCLHLEDLINNKRNDAQKKKKISIFFRYCCNMCSSIRPKSIRNSSDIMRWFVFSPLSFFPSLIAFVFTYIVHAVPLHHSQLSPKIFTSTLAQWPNATTHMHVTACCTRIYDVFCMRRMNATVAEQQQHPFVFIRPK